MKVLRDKKAIALFLSPALLVYSVLVMIPIALTFYYSMLHWDGLGKKRWIGEADARCGLCEGPWQ